MKSPDRTSGPRMRLAGTLLAFSAFVPGASGDDRASARAFPPPARPAAVSASTGAPIARPRPAATSGLPALPPRDGGLRRTSTAEVAASPRADAGDDQIGLVGRRITLNGAGSVPRGGLAYRWFALGGPNLEEASQEGGFFSFVPAASGTYRIGLVVAAQGPAGPIISEPDEVVVTVGEAPSNVGVGGPGVATGAIDQMLAGPGAEAGRATLGRSAEVFDAIAGRAGLYTTFSELSGEMARRLDEVVPAEPAWRQFWMQAIFAPLTQHLTGEMLSAGLDLRGPQGQSQPLSAAQQERLERLFSSYAREFRSRARAR